MGKKRPKVHGDRICIQCKGICHEGSYRHKVPRGYGFRSHYFCSKSCFRNHEEIAAKKRFRKSGLSYSSIEQIFNSADWKKNLRRRLQDHYERVDVITL